MENTKDQYIGAEIHSARSVNPDGETVTLDGDTVVWTGEEDVLTPEELEAEAAAIARRQNTTVAELKRFLGEDLAMLQSDLKKRKAAAWACEQMAAAG